MSCRLDSDDDLGFAMSLTYTLHPVTQPSEAFAAVAEFEDPGQFDSPPVESPRVMVCASDVDSYHQTGFFYLINPLVLFTIHLELLLTDVLVLWSGYQLDSMGWGFFFQPPFYSLNGNAPSVL